MKTICLAKENIYLVSFIFSLFSFLSVLLVARLYLAGVDFGVMPESHGATANFDLIRALVYPVVIAPLWETLIFQATPLYYLRRLVPNDWGLVLISASWFAAAHLSNSVMNAVQTFFVGIILATAFVYWSRKDEGCNNGGSKTGSYQKGFESTMMIHSLHNLYQFGLSLVPASLIF